MFLISFVYSLGAIIYRCSLLAKIQDVLTVRYVDKRWIPRNGSLRSSRSPSNAQETTTKSPLRHFASNLSSKEEQQNHANLNAKKTIPLTSKLPDQVI